MTDQDSQNSTEQLEITKNSHSEEKAFFYPVITSILVFLLIGVILANDEIRIVFVAIFAVAVSPKLVARLVSNEVKGENSYIFFQKVSDGICKFTQQIWNVIVHGDQNK